MNNILEYLERNVELMPDKIALAINNETITFKELSIQSKKLAVTISKSSNDNGVAVFVNRGINTIVLFMAAIYSGNFYIPIDPNMPVEKIQSIINDANPSVILGEDANEELANALDFDGNFITLSDSSNEMCCLPEIGENSPLYMIYTSGSTGKPKGVLKNHKAMISFVETYVKTFEFSSDEIIGNQTPLFFDASAKDIYLMLKTGSTLDIIPTEKFSMPTTLIEYMNDKRISFISWVPTAFSIVAQLRTFSFIRPVYLKKAFFVGEVMPMKTLNYWRKFLPEVKYVNLYGQSELAGVSCFYDVEGEFENDDTLPMGKTFSNCEIFLVDQEQNITSANQIGEMYVVSDALATEYYNDEEKTKASFIIRDFGNGAVRALKTGDLAYYNEEGLLIFASRTDFQIKHLGHRIELGEIETVAGALDDLQSCCCLYNEKKQQITLFCEILNGSEITPVEIRSILKKKLSTYMVPEKVIILDAMPINANGKINRQYLKELLK